MVQALELRRQAKHILAINEACDKVSACLSLSAAIERVEVILNTEEIFSNIVVGRPIKPNLVNALEVPKRKANTMQGRLGMIHALAHIEFNAINLALDVIVRFDHLPNDFYWDWWQVASEEAYHFSMLRTYLQENNADYGDFTAHNGLWEMAERTRHKLTDRMAMVPRTLEARGLDACPLMRDKLEQVGDYKAVKIIDIILDDEIRHVALGNRWFIYACERDNIHPILNYRRLKLEHGAPNLRPPFNIEARRMAGFFEEELLELQQL